MHDNRSSEENRTGVPDSTSRAAGVVETLILNCEQIFGPVEFAVNSIHNYNSTQFYN